MDNERAGLARDYAETLETLAAEAVAQGDLGHAADPIWDPWRGTPSYVALLKKLKLDF